MSNIPASLHTILLAVNDLSFGGAQHTVVAEANELTRMGYRVFVLTLLPERSLEDCLTIPRERILAIPFRGFADVRAFAKLVHLLRDIRPDVVISNLFFTNTLIRLARILLPKLRVIVREGNMPVEKSFFVKIIDFAFAFFTERIIINAAALECPFVHLGIPRRKIALVYNGINANFFVSGAVTKNAARAHFGVPTDAFVIATVGSLTRKKGYEYLLRAFANLPSVAHLFIVGDGPRRTPLASIADSLNVNGRVHFLGTQKDIHIVLAAADAFALPSLWEGMPNALLEAMAVGCAVVATDVGGAKEFLENGTNGLLVPPADSDALARALRRLMEWKIFRSRLGERARETVRDLSWERHARDLLAVIEKKTRKIPSFLPE